MTRSPRPKVADARGNVRAPIILTLVDFYPPAFRAGGPTRSVPRIVDELSDEFEFLVITRDRDLGTSARLCGVIADRWVDCGSARCLYLSARRRRMGGLIYALRRSRHDVIYLNSIFSIEFGLIPLMIRKLRVVSRRGLVVAPRGELDGSALAIKGRRKALYLWLVRSMRLVDNATWHAANQEEAHAIKRRFGAKATVLIAADIPMRPGVQTDAPSKQPGFLEVVFLSRISRMKNLDFAIEALMTVRGSVTFSVFGPIEDEPYWDECQRLSRRLPKNVTFHYGGLVEPDEILQVLGHHHLLFLPTRGESFGHAIVEAFLAGCPVLISDQTPWHNLEARRAGWELPLSRPDQFGELISRCVAMTQEEFRTWAAGARHLGREIAEDPARSSAYRLIFRAALNRGEEAPFRTHG